MKPEDDAIGASAAAPAADAGSSAAARERLVLASLAVGTALEWVRPQWARLHRVRELALALPRCERPLRSRLLALVCWLVCSLSSAGRSGPAAVELRPDRAGEGPGELL